MYPIGYIPIKNQSFKSRPVRHPPVPPASLHPAGSSHNSPKASRPVSAPSRWIRNVNRFDYKILSGWWYTYPSEKFEFVSWDDYSQVNGKIKFMFETINQLL